MPTSINVYKDYSEWNATIATGTFNRDENVTGDGGQTGRLLGPLNGNIFKIYSGDWSTVASITGDSSGATATLDSIVLTTYEIGDQKFWGGYSWTNLTGLSGIAIDVLTLDSNWIKDVYSTTDYNKALDVIEYDYINDFISRRYEVEGNNDVVYTYKTNIDFGKDFVPPNSIAVFMFGNVFSSDDYAGVCNNKIDSSYFECVNFTGGLIKNNTIIKASKIFNNIVSGITDNILTSSTIENHIALSSSIGSNILNYSTISGNNFKNFFGVYTNILNNSHITNTVFNEEFIFNTLNRSSINTSVIIPSSISNNIFDYCTIDGDLTSATIIFGDYPKTAYKRPDGTTKIRYYNDSDVLVIADITD